MCKRIVLLLAAVACLMAPLCGCKHKSAAAPSTLGDGANARGDVKRLAPERMLIWTAHVSVRVRNIPDAVREATAVVEKAGGYIEDNSESAGRDASLRIRIPAAGFHEALGSFENLGRVTSRQIGGRDVTEEYVDVEARLKNKAVLRDSLKELLAKATDVKDILAIETELNRVQGEMDSMEARIKVLKEQVDLATINLSLERGKVYGPFGYFFKGLWWGLEKLFVIRK